MINPIEAEQLAKDMADQLRVKLSYKSVQLDYADSQSSVNFHKDMLSKYVSTDLMSGENQDAATKTA